MPTSNTFELLSGVKLICGSVTCVDINLSSNILSIFSLFEELCPKSSPEFPKSSKGVWSGEDKLFSPTELSSCRASSLTSSGSLKDKTSSSNFCAIGFSVSFIEGASSITAA